MNLQQNQNTIEQTVRNFPTTFGIYIMKNKTEEIIYIGKAKNLRKRVLSYFENTKDQSIKTIFLIKHISQIDFIVTQTEAEAYLLEATLIKKHRPKYNIRLKDDKAYPYLKITYSEDIPRLYLSRKAFKDGNLYFGPYTSGLTVKDLMIFLNSTFLIRNCANSVMKNRNRPCISYQIKRCSAPCMNLISQDNYRKNIDFAINFLKGESSSFIENLRFQMNDFAAQERFEAAARMRDVIKAIETICEKQLVVTQDDQEKDIIYCLLQPEGILIETIHLRQGRLTGTRSHFLADQKWKNNSELDTGDLIASFINQYYLDNIIPDQIICHSDIIKSIDITLISKILSERSEKPVCINAPNNENEINEMLLQLAKNNADQHWKEELKKYSNRRQGLEDIKQMLYLKKFPYRIECYDISHLQGSETVASRVVFEDGVAVKDQYRRYLLKNDSIDDFESMKEVLKRRFSVSHNVENKHNHTNQLPDLIVVDGGKGQLNKALAILKELNIDIPVVAIAKARTKHDFQSEKIRTSSERIFISGRQNPILLKANQPSYSIMVHIRDEAHRFAISYHRIRQNKKTLNTAQ